jgi:hypothetical protein
MTQEADLNLATKLALRVQNAQRIYGNTGTAWDELQKRWLEKKGKATHWQSQPRVPKGKPTGGEWMGGPTGGGSAAPALWKVPAPEKATPEPEPKFSLPDNIAPLQAVDKKNAERWEKDAKRLQAKGVAPELNTSETAAVRAYSEDNPPHFKTINKTLRHDDPTMDAVRERYSGTVQLFDQALAKLPNHTGKVQRVANLPPDVLAKLTPGTTFKDHGYVSSSATTKPLTSKFLGKTLMTITSKTGKDISKLSTLPSEKEVVFGRGTGFKVTAVTTKGDRTYVEMEEL